PMGHSCEDEIASRDREPGYGFREPTAAGRPRGASRRRNRNERGRRISLPERVLRNVAGRSRVRDGPAGAAVANERWNGRTPSTGGSRWAVRVFHSHDSNRG